MKNPKLRGYIAFCKVGGRASFQMQNGLRSDCALLPWMGSSFFITKIWRNKNEEDRFPAAKEAEPMKILPFSKTYEGRTVLDFPGMELQPGKIYAVIGANGSGKSTFAKVLT